MRVFGIGDIHGCYQTLQELMECIKPTAEDKLIFLGDYIDRGPNAKQVIDYIIKLKEDGLDIITLKGNHEEMLLHAGLGKNELLTWMYNGGKFTLDSFGVKSPTEIDSHYLEFIENLPHYYRFEEVYFVHAGFNEEPGLYFTDKKAMLWLRKENYHSDFFKDKQIIHGHTPQRLEILKQNLVNKHNVLNLDTGCVYNTEKGFGYMTALEINSLELITVRNTELINLF